MSRLVPVLSAVLVAWPAAALACGGLFALAADEELAQGIGFEVAISATAEQTVIWDRIEWTGDASKFAWILPVAVTPTAIEMAHEGFFQHLRTRSAPMVFEPWGDDSGSSSFGCGFAGDTMLSGEGRLDRVELVSSGTVGDYEFVVLKGVDAKSIDKWLIEQGYAVPDADRSMLQLYVDRGWLFLAMRFKLGAKANSARTLRITLPGHHPTVPLQLLSKSEAGPLDITVWAISDKRQAAKGYDSAVLDGTKLWWLSDLQRSTYLELLGETVSDAGGRAFVTEHAAPWFPPTWSDEPGAKDFEVARKGWSGTIWLTRLRTRIEAKALTIDLELEPSQDIAQIRLEYHLSKEQKAWGGKGSTMGLIGLVLLVLLFRRRVVHGQTDRP